jgi:hypothetical protein
LGSCAPFVNDALRRALVERVTRALEPCHSGWVGVPGADIQHLTLTGLVRIQQAKVLIEAFINRRGRRRAANRRDQEKA